MHKDRFHSKHSGHLCTACFVTGIDYFFLLNEEDCYKANQFPNVWMSSPVHMLTIHLCKILDQTRSTTDCNGTDALIASVCSCAEGVPLPPLQILVSTKLPPPPSPPLLPQLVRRTDAQLQNSTQLLPKLMALHVSASLASLRSAFPIALPLLANVESRSSHVLQDGRPAGRT